jgi:ribosome-binding factor A
MSHHPYPRVRRLNAVIQEVLADEVERLADPRLGLVTVTGVEVAPDQRKAVVYASALDPTHLDDTLKALRSAAPRLRKAIGTQVRMKYTPALEFKADSGIIEGEHIDDVLRRLHGEGTHE